MNREKLVRRHCPHLEEIDLSSPLTVGNGGFAFTADITGFQTLYGTYEKAFPLCCMAEWAWHTTPRTAAEEGDLIMTEYAHAGRTVRYPVEQKVGNEGVYNWLRHNPHKFNLARVFLVSDGREIKADDVAAISQTLDIFEGRLESRFEVNGTAVKVETICDFESDTLGFSVETDGDFSVRIAFPYGHHGMAASNWNSTNSDKHFSVLRQNSIVRNMDNICYSVGVCGGEIAKITEHVFEIFGGEFTLNFSKCEKNADEKNTNNVLTFAALKERTAATWSDFWLKCGLVDFSQSADLRAAELERRVILSLYLCRIQSCGALPPAETGLTLNSWYGRFHLEMHAWHSAFWAFFGCSELLERSLGWYKAVLPKARANAQFNGFAGARWQKQCCPDGTDSPSPIAPLLIWQQPHILYMLDLVAELGGKGREFLADFWEIVKETADFMCDFAHFEKNGENERFCLVAPIIPAQEEHDPKIVKNPTFELEYWRYGLKIAMKWAEKLEIEIDKSWRTVYNKIADLPHDGEVYLAHENCPTTFVEFNRDHPSMVAALGLLPQDRADAVIMRRTLERVVECWEMDTMWGWDFAMMAMTAARLGEAELAVDLLLLDTPKNAYVASGNNFQRTREDLPLYLPGNGSLLLAVAAIVGRLPKGWTAEVEGILGV
ncbi:MAG: hypothetical protein FWG65_11195 [Turicibacter sp.]|nr:hypothetical protein [Turicibacter sp.]